jgi:DNA-binding winged helix-turn-helix (wHTH) protein
VTVHFGAFTLDTGARRLLRLGAEIHLSPKAFDLLTLLVERRPAVVQKAELRRHLWRGIHVVDASLSNLVAEIRAALADESSSASPIRTAHGVGYSFAGEVIDGDAGSAPRAPATPVWIVWQQRAIPLSPGENVIGRDGTCAVFIDADGVSRRHASITVYSENAAWRASIVDLQSTNGTYVDGRRVTGAQQLSTGERIEMGRATVVFRAATDRDVPTRKVRRRTS